MRLFFVLFCLLDTIPAVAFDVTYGIDTVAGTDWIGDDGPALRALLLQAEGIAVDPNGNLYIAEAAGNRIRKVTRAGIISTVAGIGTPGYSGDGGPALMAQLNSPYGLACDGLGNLFIADLGNARVRRVTADGVIATVAGGGSLPAGGINEGSPATAVSLAAPRNVALDGSGNLYISDFNAHRVYRLGPGVSSDVSLPAYLTTAAGTGIQGYSGDGATAMHAQLSYPTAVAVDRQGALFIADSGNHRIRKVAGGIVTSIARAATPTGLAIDGFGTVYVADPSAGLILSLPVNGKGTNLSVAAWDLTFGVDGYLYATNGPIVRRVSFSGPSVVVAGGGSPAFGDGGDATLARLTHPSGVAADGLGNIFIADRDNHRIRRVAKDGTIRTIAGTGAAGDSGDNGLATQAALNSPASVTVDGAGTIYIADTGNHRVRVVTPSGTIFPWTTPGLISPTYVLADALGNLYISDSGNGTIRKVTPAGAVTILLDQLQGPRGLALDFAGNLYFTEVDGGHVRRLGRSGDLTTFGEGIWSVPRGIAVSATGDVLVADTGLQQILRIDAVGQVTPIAGTGSAGFGGDGASALAAELGFPWDICSGAAGAFYIADLDNNRIRRLTPDAVVSVNPTALFNVVNAASLQPGPLAPGMLLALRGTGLTAADAADTQILFGNFSAPILSLDAARILVQAPPQIAGLPSVQIGITYKGTPRAQVLAAVVDAAPALYASASNEDGTLNSTSNPALRGSVMVFYGTGEGVTGLPISLNIGGYTAEILYAGGVIGYPGLLQINARVPAGYIAPGMLGVTITVGQTSSQPGVTIAVN